MGHSREANSINDIRITNYDSRMSYNKKGDSFLEQITFYRFYLFNYGRRSGEISVVDKVHFDGAD